MNKFIKIMVFAVVGLISASMFAGRGGGGHGGGGGYHGGGRGGYHGGHGYHHGGYYDGGLGIGIYDGDYYDDDYYGGDVIYNDNDDNDDGVGLGIETPIGDLGVEL